MTILAKILAEKHREVTHLKKTFIPDHTKRSTPIRSFIKRCQGDQSIQLIAEFKRASPSKGVINASLEPEKQARNYQELGASMISVLTDQTFFRGTYHDLATVKKTVELPVLNKDFIIDQIQIDRAYQHGADVILLIAASLPKADLTTLFQYAKQLGLEVLFEVHDEEELAVAKKIGAQLIGVNNRNLKTFDVDLATTEKLAQSIDHDKAILVSESGIKTRDDILRLKRSGTKAVLVGETLMRSTDLPQTFRDILVDEKG